MATIKCPKCGDQSDRLHRYNSGEQWMCPSCYVGMFCHPTPQTQWPEPDEDQDDKPQPYNVLNDWKVRENVRKVVDKNCEDVEWEGTTVNRSGIVDEVLQMMKEFMEKHP